MYAIVWLYAVSSILYTIKCNMHQSTPYLGLGDKRGRGRNCPDTGGDETKECI